MARLNDVQRAVFGYWYPLISDAARAGFTVTDTVQLANQVARDLGGSITPAQNRAISQLYGYVRREVNAGDTFQAAQASQYINQDMISTPAYARDEAEQATYPVYHVKMQYEAIDAAGNRISTTKTVVFDDLLPATVGELTSDVLDAAEAMAKKYGHTLLSVRPLMILAV